MYLSANQRYIDIQRRIWDVNSYQLPQNVLFASTFVFEADNFN
jgi:hypothetical protein